MKRNLMKEAHKMTREIVNKYGDVDYMTQLGLCLSFLSQEGGKEMVELKGTEKQVKWAEDLRARYSKMVDYAKTLVNEIGVTDEIAEELEECGFESIEEAFNTLANTEKASKIISVFKVYRTDEQVEKSIKKFEKNIWYVYPSGKKERRVSEIECVICGVLSDLEELRDAK